MNQVLNNNIIQNECKTSGIVICRNILSIDEQLKLIEKIEHTGGLKNTKHKWNYFGHRGRLFCNLNKYDKYVISLMTRIKEIVENLDQTLVWKPFTHMLTQWYPTNRGIGWHTDSYGGNDGDEGAPVYSLSLGNSCIFEYSLVGTKKRISIELNSGNIIVFGGAQRLMWHCVKSIKMGSFTLKDNFNARINLTLRTCTDFTEEDEARYQTDAYVSNLIKKKEEALCFRNLIS